MCSVKLVHDQKCMTMLIFVILDENKMDKLLIETDGSRRLSNQIVQRVFAPQDKCFMIKGPTVSFVDIIFLLYRICFSYLQPSVFIQAWECLGIEVKGCLLRYEGPDSCVVCKDKEKTEKIHGARYLMPFTREKPRIEVRNLVHFPQKDFKFVGQFWNSF